MEYPDRELKVPVTFDVLPCEHSLVEFKLTKLFRTYIINDDEFSQGLPDLKTTPDCGRVPLLEDIIFEVVSVPEGIDPEELVKFNL